MTKRKRQITRELIDTDANKMQIAVDMGWGDPYWANLKARALTESILALGDKPWTMFRVQHEREDAFTKRLDRAFNAQKVDAEYFVVRSQESLDEPILASFFVRGLSLANIWSDLIGYTIEKPVPVSGDTLVAELHRLFDSRRHPDVKNIRRWSSSRHTTQQLRLARMTILISMARNRVEHDLVENPPTMVSFEHRMADCTKADLPLMHKLSDRQVADLLAVCIQMELLSDYEAARVMQIRQPSGKWENLGMYAGLPKHGVERDEASGSYIRHFVGRHSASEFRVDGKTLAEADWEPYEMPSVPEDERYLE